MEGKVRKVTVSQMVKITSYIIATVYTASKLHSILLGFQIYEG